jgi:hypothetical protein
MNAEIKPIDMKLDHFRIYDLQNPYKVRVIPPEVPNLDGNVWVELLTTYPGSGTITLGSLIKFGDRVNKGKSKTELEGCYDENAHLTWYSLKPPITPVSFNLNIYDQFFPEGQVIHIESRVGLLVPAQKKLKSMRRFSQKTADLDHFMVYKTQVIQHPLITVYLLDQFGLEPTSTSVGELQYFAVPGIKRKPIGLEKDGGVIYKDYPPRHPFNFLTIYKVTPLDLNGLQINIRDQFLPPTGLLGRKLGMSYLLAVPSKLMPRE